MILRFTLTNDFDRAKWIYKQEFTHSYKLEHAIELTSIEVRTINTTFIDIYGALNGNEFRLLQHYSKIGEIDRVGSSSSKKTLFDLTALKRKVDFIKIIVYQPFNNQLYCLVKAKVKALSPAANIDVRIAEHLKDTPDAASSTTMVESPSDTSGATTATASESNMQDEVTS